MATMLGFLLGCDSAQDGSRQAPWLETAIVVDMGPPLQGQPLADRLGRIEKIGFDTLLFDARSSSDDEIDALLKDAAAYHLKVAIWIKPPLEGPEGLAEAWPTSSGTLPNPDAWIMTIREAADLEGAKRLRSRLQAAGSDTALIAYLANRADAPWLSALDTTGTPVFDAVLTDQITGIEQRDGNLFDLWLAQIAWEPGETSAPYAESTSVEKQLDLPQWRRLSHCEESIHAVCSKDIRLLVAGFMQPTTPVTLPLDEPFWHDVYRALISAREAHPWIRNGTMEWYATDREAGAVAYRITNEARAHLLVALNVSDRHLELPLPFGFMADSKIKLWASYDPTLRELVTNKPVALPARSAVIVIKD